jgi:hypothetical protein
MAKPTKEQIAWFQEWWREIMGDSIDADLAQSWFEKFPDMTKEEARKTLELLRPPKFAPFLQACEFRRDAAAIFPPARSVA